MKRCTASHVLTFLQSYITQRNNATVYFLIEIGYAKIHEELFI